jgi:LysM repeat protein
MWATFRTTEDCILTLFKEPPSPVGQALLTLKLVILVWSKLLLKGCRSTYVRISQNRLRLASVISVSGSLVILLVSWAHSAPTIFADGEQDRIGFILETYINPETLTLNQDTGLQEIAYSGENIGGSLNADEITNDQREHVVAQGQTLGGIAQLYNLSSTDFLIANPDLQSPDLIYPGLKLKVPENAATPEQVEQTKAALAKKEADKKAKSAIGSTKKTVVLADANSFGKPIARGDLEYISQYFGQDGHKGIDLVVPTGTRVYSASAGTVIRAATGSNGGYGTYVVVKVGNKNFIYGHLSKLLVRQGDTVSVGNLLGLSGSTGHSTGPHLHFEVRVNDVAGNPIPYIGNY